MSLSSIHLPYNLFPMEIRNKFRSKQFIMPLRTKQDFKISLGPTTLLRTHFIHHTSHANFLFLPLYRGEKENSHEKYDRRSQCFRKLLTRAIEEMRSNMWMNYKKSFLLSPKKLYIQEMFSSHTQVPTVPCGSLDSLSTSHGKWSVCVHTLQLSEYFLENIRRVGGTVPTDQRSVGTCVRQIKINLYFQKNKSILESTESNERLKIFREMKVSFSYMMKQIATMTRKFHTTGFIRYGQAYYNKFSSEYGVRTPHCKAHHKIAMPYPVENPSKSVYSPLISFVKSSIKCTPIHELSDDAKDSKSTKKVSFLLKNTIACERVVHYTDEDDIDTKSSYWTELNSRSSLKHMVLNGFRVVHGSDSNI